MTKPCKKLWAPFLAATVLLLCYSSDALAQNPVYGNASVRGFKSMSGTVSVGSGPTNSFRRYSTGSPEYKPGPGSDSVFTLRNKAKNNGFNINRKSSHSGNTINSRQNTMAPTNRLSLTSSRSGRANPSSGANISKKQRPIRGQSGDNLASKLASVPTYTPGFTNTANELTANTLIGKYAKIGSWRSGINRQSYGGGLARRKSELSNYQSVLTSVKSIFDTSGSILTQQRNQFRSSGLRRNLGRAASSSFGSTGGISRRGSLTNPASSLK